jgi:hypothetical protein
MPPTKVQHQIESRKMHFRRSEGEGARIHIVRAWNQSRPQKNHGHHQNGPHTQREVHIPIERAGDSPLQAPQKIRYVRLDGGGSVSLV